MNPFNNRREFIKQSASAGLAISLAGGELFSQEQPSSEYKRLETVRVGFVGVGVKGSAHVGNLLRTGVEPDFTVYDAAAWSAIAPLSEASVANRSSAVDFPDFTRGKWKTTPPLRMFGV